MCVVSMVGDYYGDKWTRQYPAYTVTYTTPVEVSREDFDALKKEVEEMKELLKRAKAYDEANNEPNCEMEQKIALLRKVAELVGVDLSEVFGHGAG